MESLEGRSLLTTFTWNQAVSGNFSDPTKWVDAQNRHGVPGPNDSAVTIVPATGTYTITSSGSATVGSFSGGAVLNLSGGTFTVTNAAAGASSSVNTLIVSAGASFRAQKGTTALARGEVGGNIDSATGATVAFAGQSFLASGSTLTGAGTFSVGSQLDIRAKITAPKLLVVTDSGRLTAGGASSSLTVPAGATMDWQGGTIASSVVVAQGGALTIEGSAAKFLNTVTLSIAGSASLTGTGNFFISGQGTLLNQPTGVIRLASGSQFMGGVNGSFTNAGTLEKVGNTGTSMISVPLTNSGTIRVDSQGVLGVTAGFTQTSTGSLVVEVSGASSTNQFGQFQSTGTTNLGGSLAASLGIVAGGRPYVPITGQVFPIVTFGATTGKFSNFTSPTINTLPAFNSRGKATGVDLVANETKPLAPTGLALLAADDSGTKGDRATVITQPRITGKATPGLLVQIYDQNVRLIASAVAAADGTFSAKPITALAVGSYTLKAVAIDSANRFGANSATYSLTIVAKPLAPTGLALLAADDSGTKGDRITVITQPHITGTAQAGRLVQIYDQNQRLIASATALANGTFSAKPITALAVGSYSLTAVAIDSFGNYGPNSSPLVMKIVAKTSAPSGLNIYPADDTGGPGVTAIYQPRLTGRAPAGLLVQIFDQNQRLIGSAKAATNGTFVVTPTVTLGPGIYSFRAMAVDSFGNPGNSSPILSVRITAPPAAPTGLALFPADQTNGPGATNKPKPRLTGKTQAGLLVQIYDQNHRLIASARAASNGTFVATTTVALAKGRYTLKAVAIDAGNHFGANSLGYALTVV